MGTHIVKEGNSFYEIDDTCVCEKKRKGKEEGTRPDSSETVFQTEKKAASFFGYPEP